MNHKCDFLLIFTVLWLFYDCFATVLRLIGVFVDEQVPPQRRLQ